MHVSPIVVLVALLLGARTAQAQAPLTGPAGTITPREPVCRQRLDPDQRARRPLGGLAFDVYVSETWPGGIVPVLFAEDIAASQQAHVLAACAAWSAGTGVRCVARTTEPTYVEVRTSEKECSSHVGRRRSGLPTVVSLGPDCWSPRTLQHELGHALGLIHEHQRADRDDYLQVDLTQVEPDAVDNFERLATSRDHTPYDFASVMHYYESSFAISPGRRVLTPQPAFQGARLGGNRISTTDMRFVASLYGVGYATAGSGRPGPPVPFRIGTHEALSAMQAIDRFYRAPEGLARDNGLSIGGRPDFLGLAAWFFDVYVATRYAGYEEADARYNVAASITQTDEWRGKHPGWAPATPLPGASRLPFTREELLVVMERLDRFYAAPEGLQRPDGLSIGGGPDLLGIATWVVDVYLGARLSGVSAQGAWSGVEQAIRASDEWRSKH
jgi:hypothetical protein